MFGPAICWTGRVGVGQLLSVARGRSTPGQNRSAAEDLSGYIAPMPWLGSKRLSRRQASARRASAVSRVGLLHGLGSLAAVLALLIQFFLPFMPMLQTAYGDPATREQVVDSWTRSSICLAEGVPHHQYPGRQGQLPCPECPICQVLHQTASLLPPIAASQVLAFSLLGRLEPIIETEASSPSHPSPSQPRAPPALT